MDEYDVLIKNAIIVDGTGAKPFKGSIAVAGDKIAALGDTGGDAKKIVDAEGFTAFPGFIDAHSHADWTLLWYPECESYVMQGVTTFIGGQCGGSPAPLGNTVRLPRLLRDHIFDLQPYKFYTGKPFYPIDQVNRWMEDIYGWALDWETMGDYFERVETTGISANYAPLLGHGSVRTKVMGLDYRRDSTTEERDLMHALIAEGMDQGCIGMSVGMDYDPDSFATRDEITEAVRVLKPYGRVYCPHALLTGRRRGWASGHSLNEKITGFMDEVDTYRKTGVRLHIAHLTQGWDVTPRSSEELDAANFQATIEAVTKESRGDLDITYDTMPVFIRGGYDMQTYLCSLLEPWLRQLGGREALGRWLRLKEFREEIKDAISQGKWYIRTYTNPVINPRWAENIYITRSSSPGTEGKSIAQIAENRATDPWDAWFDVIAEDPDTRAVTDFMVRTKKSIEVLYRNPLSSVGLDVALYDDKYQPRNPPYRIPGVLTYSGFPLFVKTVLDNAILPLEQIALKTSVSAARAHILKDRGTLTPGSYADIVLMDLERLEITGDGLESRKYAKGVEHVFVNGEAVVENGRHTGARSGRVLKAE